MLFDNILEEAVDRLKLLHSQLGSSFKSYLHLAENGLNVNEVPNDNYYLKSEYDANRDTFFVVVGVNDKVICSELLGDKQFKVKPKADIEWLIPVLLAKGTVLMNFRDLQGVRLSLVDNKKVKTLRLENLYTERQQLFSELEQINTNILLLENEIKGM